ncbi:hypothetical protein BH23THE1_BH23THE1_26600 [soil metagenome]
MCATIEKYSEIYLSYIVLFLTSPEITTDAFHFRSFNALTLINCYCRVYYGFTSIRITKVNKSGDEL